MADAELSEFDQIHTLADTLREQIHRRVIGQEQAVRLLTVGVLAGGHTLLIGVPGLAKTMLVRSLAEALGWSFRRIQFTPDMMPSDVVGSELVQADAATGRREMAFMPGPVFANLVLADEINRTPPRTQAALLEAMAERQVTAGGRTMPLEAPFVVVATQNPIEQEGTYPLPEAQLDRFMLSLNIAYPDADEERRIVADVPPDFRRAVAQEPVVDKAQAARAGDLIGRMPVSDHVLHYAVMLARASRPDDASAPEAVREYVAWGAGPRAGQYLVLGARALAAIEGRPTPSCDDVRQLAPAVLSHRIVTNYAAVGEGVDVAQIVAAVVDEVAEPG